MKRTGYIVLLFVFTVLLMMIPFSLAENNQEQKLVSNIVLSETDVVLTTGSNIVVSAKASPEDAANPKVAWSSTDEKIASVTKGKIVAKGAGECDIICSATDESGVQAICHVEVRTPVKRITINEKQVILWVGASKESAMTSLTYTISPEDAYWQDVTWASSDEETVIVSSDGSVKGLKPGKAVITAYSTQPDSKVKAQAQIIVRQAVTGIELNAVDIRLEVKKRTTIKPAVFPDNAYNKKITWSSSDESIAKVNAQGQVSGISSGEVIITASSMDGSEVTASCKVSVFVPVKKIQLNEGQNLSLFAGLPKTITATIEPEDATNQKLLWTSSDETVAAVDENGTITGLSFGKTTITATAMDGSNANGTTVVWIFQPLNSISLEHEGTDSIITESISMSDYKIQMDNLFAFIEAHVDDLGDLKIGTANFPPVQMLSSYPSFMIELNEKVKDIHPVIRYSDESKILYFQLPDSVEIIEKLFYGENHSVDVDPPTLYALWRFGRGSKSYTPAEYDGSSYQVVLDDPDMKYEKLSGCNIEWIWYDSKSGFGCKLLITYAIENGIIVERSANTGLFAGYYPEDSDRIINHFSDPMSLNDNGKYDFEGRFGNHNGCMMFGWQTGRQSAKKLKGEIKDVIYLMVADESRSKVRYPWGIQFTFEMDNSDVLELYGINPPFGEFSK